MSIGRIHHDTSTFDSVINFWDVLKVLKTTDVEVNHGHRELILLQQYNNRLLELKGIKLHQFGELIFSMLSDNVYPDTAFFNNVLFRLMYWQQIHYSQALYKIMIERGVANDQTYALALKTIRRSLGPYTIKDGMTVLNAAIRAHQLNHQTVYHVLKLLESNRYNYAKVVMNVIKLAKQNGVEDESLYSLAIQILMKWPTDQVKYTVLEYSEAKLLLARSKALDDVIEKPIMNEPAQAVPVVTKAKINPSEKPNKKYECSFGLFAKSAAAVVVTSAVIATFVI